MANNNATPNQQNLFDIIKETIKNKDDIINLIKNLSIAVNYTEKIDIKKLKKNSKNFVVIGDIMYSYVTSLGEIVQVLEKDFSGNSINNILSSVDEIQNADGTITKKNKYSSLDAISAISNTFITMTKNMNALANFEGGFFAVRRLKRNIKNLSGVVMDMMGTMIKEFNKPKNYNGILNTLVSDPQTIETITDIEKDDTNKTLKDRSKTITKQGKKGLLDALMDFMTLITSFINMKPPEKKENKKHTQQLLKSFQYIINSFYEVTDKYSDPKYINALNNFAGEDGIMGSMDSGKGILGLLFNIQSSIKTINSIASSGIGNTKKNLIKTLNIFEIILNFIRDMILSNNGIIYDLTSQNFQTQLEGLKKSLTLFVDSFNMINGLSLMLIIKGGLINTSLKLLNKILINLANISKTIKELAFDNSKLSDLVEFVDDLNTIIKKLNVLNLAIIGFSISSVVLIKAIKPATLGLIIISGFMLMLKIVFRIIGNTKTVVLMMKYILGATLVFTAVNGALLLITMALLSIATMAPAVIASTGLIFLLIGDITLITIALMGLGLASATAIIPVGLGIAGLLIMTSAIGMLTGMVNNLMKLQEASKDLDKEKLLTSVNTVTEIANTLLDSLFGEKSWRKKITAIKDARRTKRLLRPIKKSVKLITDIVESLNEIKDIKFTDSDKEFINSNIDLVLTTVLGDDTDENKGIINTIFEGFENNKDKTNRVKEARKTKRFLAPIEDSVGMIKDIIESFNVIKKFEFDEAGIKTKITQVINASNSIIESIFSQVVSGEKLTDEQKKANNAAINQAKNSKSYLKPITESVSLIGDIVDNINKIGDTKSFDGKIISLNGLIGSINTLSKINLETSKNNLLKDSTAFIEKIDKVKLDNLTKASSMFEAMAKFSESIQGNFEGLADSLNEKIAPLLEELNDMIGKMPDNVNNAAANISSSISANAMGPTLTPQATKEQVQRENPKATQEEIEKIADEKLKENYQAISQSITSKFDELIELIRNGEGKIQLAD